MVDVLYFVNLVAVQVKHVQLLKVLQVADLLDEILAQHEHPKSRNCVQVGDLFYLVVVEIKEDQIWQAD